MGTLLGLLLTTDVWFWDNLEAIGAGVGEHLADGRWVTAFDAKAQTYEVRAVRTATLGQVRSVTTDPETHAVGEVRVRVAPGRAFGDPIAPLSAEVLAGPANRLPSIPEGHAVPDHPVPIETLAPFSVNVSYAASAVMPGPVTLPKGYWPIVAGDAVLFDRSTYTVQQIDADRLTLLGPPDQLRRIPNANDRVLPSGYLIAIATGLGALVWRWRRR